MDFFAPKVFRLPKVFDKTPKVFGNYRDRIYLPLSAPKNVTKNPACGKQVKIDKNELKPDRLSEMVFLSETISNQRWACLSFSMLYACLNVLGMPKLACA